MKKALRIFLSLILCSHYSNAQSKIFKEVDEDIRTQMQSIRQDGALVGYLVFTQLERASEDSFNYKISIMDENLNDIGKISFREQKLDLQSVSFESDVLCLAYLKSNVIGIEYNNRKPYIKAVESAKNAIFTQFLSLQGQIIATNTDKIDLTLTPGIIMHGKFNFHYSPTGKLKHDLQLRNLPGKGFACFYGDDTKNNMFIYNTAGVKIWQKTIPDEADAFGLLTSGLNVYILMKKKEKMEEGGYELLGYSTKDSSIFPRYVLKDKKGNSLKVLRFSNDPVTGYPFIAGYIIDPDHGNKYLTSNQLSNGPYRGVFSIDLTGHKKGEIHEVYTDWADGGISSISTGGKFSGDDSYVRFEQAFRDYQGNTCFTGSAVIKRFLAARMMDATVVRQNARGVLSLDKSIPLEPSKAIHGETPFSNFDTRNYYELDNSDSKTNYLIIDDLKNIVIYNITQQKLVRNIPHKDGNIQTSIYPAKEGHVMVSEYNKKEKYTQYSIEAL